MPVASTPVFEGELRVSNVTKMSYFNGQSTSYGESYRLEIDPPERKQALSRAAADPAAEVPQSITINASLDTSNPGEPLLIEGKSYTLTLVEVAE